MHFLRKLLREIHRRSIWQVLGIYLAGSWCILQVVGSLTRYAGLPEWTPPFALVLLLIGLPVVTATAFIQKGMPSLRGEYRDEVPPEELVGRTPDEVHVDPALHPLHRERVFTWRNAILGGVGAAGLLAASVVAYLAMWTTGIGPVGSLVAQGAISEGERVVLADFANATADSTLGGVVTAAMRADLVRSPVLRVVERAGLSDVLRRMQVDPATELTPDVALEAARRDGINAVLEGEVGPVGPGYILTATLRSAASGDALAAFRVSAAGPDALIPAIGELSRDIREKAGESLRNIRAGRPLDQITTGSLDALRLYSRAEHALDGGDHPAAISLLERAVAADSTFDMAWLRLGPLYEDAGDTARAIESYRRVVDGWADGDAGARTDVRKARARLAALGATGG